MKLDRPHEALRELQRLAALSPGDVFAQLRISEAQTALDQPQQARATLDAIPRDAAGYPRAANPKQRLTAMEQLAAAYGDLGKWDRSLALGSILERDHPEDAEAHRLAARALLRLNRRREALPHLEAASSAAAGDTQTQFELADTLFQERKPGQESRIQNLLEAVVKSGRASGLAYYEL